VEVSALKTTLPATALRGPSPLLRLQSDERLIALTRRGQHAAFETLFSRYHSRLLAFCRHMLGSREDAEDVLQEVFAAAFNAVLADERAINVRPWLYRIARNRSLNHLRRASAIGVDSMDVHFADHGLSTGDQVMRRESFRQLMGDVQQLPETQRTALLLREIDALSYDQIALAMETTVPSVKSLLVRARISLAEAAEARKLSCDDVRCELGEVAEGLIKITPPARRHLRDCERCRNFRTHLKDNNHVLAAVLPVTPLLLLKRFLVTKFGASAGAGHVAGASGATATAGGVAASAGATGGASAASGIITAGAGAIATKAAATIAAAALVTAGAVAADHSARPVHRHKSTASAAAYSAAPAVAPLVVRSTPQPVTTGAPPAASATTAARQHNRRLAHNKPGGPASTTTPTDAHLHGAPDLPAKPVVAPKPVTTTPAVVEVTTETTQLSPAATTTTETATSPATTTAPPPATTPTTSTAPEPATTTPAVPAPATETPEPGAEGAETPADTPPAVATEAEAEATTDSSSGTPVGQ
jgi:RNA polymerase sigma factor (sigma-70 family)